MVKGKYIVVGKKIQALRKQKGYTLSMLAERAGVAKSYLSNIERGIQDNPSIHFLEKVSAILGVPMESLLYEQSQWDESVMDSQWVKLIQDAMASGISKEEFKEFLDFQKWKQNNPK